MAMSQHGIDFTDRCVGTILGAAFGDALGAPVEGWTPKAIRNEFGEVRDYVEARLGAGCYTDDTQMLLATGRSLVRCHGVDGAVCASSCAELFDPDRGYGRSATAILNALRDGADYRETATMLFPEGSFGNGAAMRIAPVGLLFEPDDISDLRRDVAEAVRATHTHPEAVDGAFLVAVAVAGLSRMADYRSFDPVERLRQYSSLCHDDQMRARVGLAADLLSKKVKVDDAVVQLGNGVRTIDSVPTALYLAFRYIDDPEQAIIESVGAGGDADTIAAMCGAVVGAMHGAEALPQRWHDGLERGEDGYDALREVAVQLSELIT